MAAVSGVRVMRDATVKIEAVEYANQCVKVRFVPDQSIQVQRTLVPDGAITDTDSPTWTCEMTILQKNETGGLAKAIRDAAIGSDLDVIFAPQATVDASATVTAVLRAIAIPFGGEQGSFNNLEIVLPVVGSPTFGLLDLTP